MAQDLIDSGLLPIEHLTLRDNRLAIAAVGYFILSDSYKQWRLAELHNTETPKIAALNAIAIMKARPFVPNHREDIELESVVLANSIFAVACALAIVGKELSTESPADQDFLRRLLELLEEIDCQILEPFIIDIEYEIKKKYESYVTGIPKNDILPINSLISIFELISGKIKI